MTDIPVFRQTLVSKALVHSLLVDMDALNSTTCPSQPLIFQCSSTKLIYDYSRVDAWEGCGEGRRRRLLDPEFSPTKKVLSPAT